MPKQKWLWSGFAFSVTIFFLGRGTDGRLIRDYKKKNTSVSANEDKKYTKKNMSSIGDAHIVKHVHFIFRRAKRKWKDDVSLHLALAVFAKQARSYRELGKIYAEALQIHPRNTSLWIEAASHEFFGYVAEEGDEKESYGKRGSIANARVLLQRGLRINKSSQELWIQYFTLEWHYVQMQRGRRLVLNPDAAVQVENEDMLPGLIYRNAIKAIPKDISFCLKLLNACMAFPHTSNIESVILLSLERDFGDNADAWIARALFEFESAQIPIGVNLDSNHASSDDKKVKVLSRAKPISGMLNILAQATENLKTVEMFEKCASFLMTFLHEKFVSQDCQHYTSSLYQVTNVLETLFATSQRESLHSVALVLKHSEFLCNTARPVQAEEVLRNAAVKLYTTDSQVWIAWSNHACRRHLITARNGNITSDDILPKHTNESPVSILRRAEKSVPMYKSGHVDILVQLFDQLIQNKEAGLRREGEMENVFLKILLLSSTVTNAGISICDICLQYLSHNVTTTGLKGGRHVCDVVLFRSNLTSTSEDFDCDDMKRFFDAVILLETNAIALASKENLFQICLDGKKRLKKLYSAIISLCSNANDKVMMNYYVRRKVQND
uniref:Uncharacterized protein n=1 Tax=Proboscia inermis TaxID=420281 RepID=A0A7S0C591_9STRA|mmetsp:Transcript_28015/g.28403  ORF Transcript_28015/g.28403 Transcript_28015/m.28403 type:complete len:610 (+) Transcript_28015:503-2332(+)